MECFGMLLHLVRAVASEEDALDRLASARREGDVA